MTASPIVFVQPYLFSPKKLLKLKRNGSSAYSFSIIKNRHCLLFRFTARLHSNTLHLVHLRYGSLLVNVLGRLIHNSKSTAYKVPRPLGMTFNLLRGELRPARRGHGLMEPRVTGSLSRPILMTMNCTILNADSATV